jgi:hypothetical protein
MLLVPQESAILSYQARRRLFCRLDGATDVRMRAPFTGKGLHAFWWAPLICRQASMSGCLDRPSIAISGTRYLNTPGFFASSTISTLIIWMMVRMLANQVEWLTLMSTIRQHHA